MSLDILRQESGSEHTGERIIDITRRGTLLGIGSLILAGCSSETPEQKEKREKSEREAQEKKEKEKNKLNQLLQEKIEHLKQGGYLKIKEEFRHSKTLGNIILISHHGERGTVGVTVDKTNSKGFMYGEDIYQIHLDERNLPKEMKEKGVRLLDLNDFEIIKK